MGGTRTRECLNAYASTRAMTLAALAPLSQRQLDFSPGPGRWSIGEVADHLLRSEDLYRREIAALVELARAGKTPYRRHSLSEVNVAPLFLPTALLSLFEVPISVMTRFIPISVRGAITEFPILPVRNPDYATPQARRPAEELKADLGTSMARTRLLVDANPDVDFEALISEHPLMGRTNVAEIFTFLGQHERRHQGQMERVRTLAAFPHA